MTLLNQLIEEQHLQAAGTPAQWANESLLAAKDGSVEPGSSIEDAYFQRQLPVLNQRLALAGLRLAALLNANLKGF